MAWIFQTADPMGGATGEAFSNVLHGTGMDRASVLAREAIQNSVDAIRPDVGDKAKVVFRRQTLVGSDKARFVAELDLRNEFMARADELDLPTGNSLENLDNPNSPLELLFIEDYNTHGLYGDPHSSHSHFHRLLLSLGDSTKARVTDSTGGSYGYGKAVYSANSRIHTIVAYSVFDPKQSEDDEHCRLMGCSYFKSHELGDTEFTGRAWFGDPTAGNSSKVYPFAGELAHDIAERLGFARRTPSETGASILIIDCPVTVDELRESIEEWWWPRIIDDAFDVEIVENCNFENPPRPRSRVDLQPFIHCFEMAVGRTEPLGKHDHADAFRRLRNRGVPLGRYGFTVLDRDQNGDDEAPTRANEVALIRAPRMVVAYMEIGSLALPCVGAFVASPEANQALKLSEPPAHDKWDSQSSRFQDDVEREIVEAIVRLIKQNLRRFASEAVPKTPPGEVRLSILERLLGNMFRPPTTGASRGGSKSDPIEIDFDGGPRIEASDGLVRTVGEFRVGLRDSSDREEILVAVEVQCRPVEDDETLGEEEIPVALSAAEEAGTVADESSPSRFLVLLDRETRPHFAFASDFYRADWTASVAVHVKEQD